MLGLNRCLLTRTTSVCTIPLFLPYPLAPSHHLQPVPPNYGDNHKNRQLQKQTEANNDRVLRAIDFHVVRVWIQRDMGTVAIIEETTGAEAEIKESTGRKKDGDLA